jgi:hypothetical protein
VNIKFSAAVSTLILASASVSGITHAKAENSIGLTAAPTTSISATAYIIPLTILKAQTVTASDLVNTIAVTKSEEEILVAADALTVNVTKAFASSVTADSTLNKIFHSSVDFDMSDDDVDPDPVTVVDATAFDLGRAISETLTASDSISNEAGKVVSGDSVSTADAIDKKDVGANPTEILTASDSDAKSVATTTASTATAADSAAKTINITEASDVTVTAVVSKIFHSSVDFDMSDADVDPDPVTASDSTALSPAKSTTSTLTATDSDAKSITSVATSAAATSDSVATNPTSNQTETLTASDSTVTNPTSVQSDLITMADVLNTFTYNKYETDAVTAAESIVLTLTLGETEQMWDEVFMSDGESGFIHTPRSLAVADYDCLLNGDNSLINSAMFPDGCEADSTRYEAHTGTIGAPGLVNEPVMNHGLITYPDTSGAGLVVDFHYPTLTIGAYMANITTIT